MVVTKERSLSTERYGYIARMILAFPLFMNVAGFGRAPSGHGTVTNALQIAVKKAQFSEPILTILAMLVKGPLHR